MSTTLTPGRLMFEEIVPPDLRDDIDDGPIDVEKITRILQNTAEKAPDRYKDISHAVLKFGAKASTEVPASFTLNDLKSPIDKKKVFAEVEAAEDAIRADKTLSPKQKEAALIKLYASYSNKMPDLVYQEALKNDSNLARMVASGARGNKGQLNSNIGADWLMLDADSNPIPVPIKNSYSEGLGPAEYFASAYGTRRGLLSTKFCCAEGQKVLMADWSEKEIQDVKAGDWIMGSNADGKIVPVMVKRVFDNGVRECWRYVFRYLSSRSETVDFCGTEDHRLLARRRDWGKDKHKAIDVPSKIACGKMTKTRHVLVPAECDDFGGIDEPRALLLGILLGDGCTSPSAGSNLKLSCGDGLFLSDISQYLASLNFYASKGCESEGDFTYNLNYLNAPPKETRDGAGGRGRSFCGCPTKKWLGDMGIIGKYAHEKKIPEEIWTWNNDSVAQVLSGLFSSDSSIDRTTAASGGKGITIRLTLTAKTMVEQAKKLLQFRFGIYSSKLYFIPKEKKEHAKNDQWQISISHRRSIERFARLIPLIGIKRPELLALRTEIAQSRCNEQHTFKFLRKEPLGKLKTHDLEVDHPDHLFVLSNGIISSNSVQESGYLSKQLSAAAHDLVVTERDCETGRGIPTDPDDTDNVGSLLARDTGGFPAGTIITPRVLKQLKDNKVKSMVVRSPLTCGAHNGICSRCAGIRERNKFPDIMDNIGLAAASSVGEPLSQGTLSEKHCLHGETLVRMADLSVKRIKNIVPGELVLGSDRNGSTFPVKVLKHFSNGPRECVKTGFQLKDGTPIYLTSTSDHNVLADGFAGTASPTLPVGAIMEDMSIITVRIEADAETKLETASRKETVSMGRLPTFDIEVDHLDHLFVLANGMIVSNSGGVASLSGKAVSAFKQIDSLVQVPEVFPNGATVSGKDGVVTRIEDAPQGGKFVYVGDERHYVGHGSEVSVKRGDSLEAGDVLSSGIPNPADIVKYKGIGQGRIYFVGALRNAMKSNKISVDRRNLEVLGRALVNHVKVTDPDGYGGHLPDDVVEYSAIERDYEPENAVKIPVKKAVGKFLAKPALHYTIGTRITPSVAKTLEDNDEFEVDAIDESPGFEPEAQRVMDIPGYKQDWMAQFAGSNLKKRILKDVHSGDSVSDPHGVSYVPGLAKGTEFGKPPPGVVGY